VETKFWEKYIKADEIERHKMLDELIEFKDENGFYTHFNTTLFQGFLDDLLGTTQQMSVAPPEGENELL